MQEDTRKVQGMEMIMGLLTGLTGPEMFSLVAGSLILLVVCMLIPTLLGLRYIPNNRVGIVEKLWSTRGPLAEGRLIALDGEAGYQAEVLRGGFHFGYWLWQYRIHKVPLTVVPQGKIGYVFARDGEPLPPEQTLGRVVPCNNFQDARAFLLGEARRQARAPAGSAAASGRSSAKACTRSTWRCSS